ncbi:MAG: alkaline phosphatase family protein, partial [Pseudomonadota bacterium]
MAIEPNIEVNGRNYPAPLAPAVVICLDGCEPAYLEEAISAGLMPHLKRIRESGTDRLAHSVIPSFTNPNNLSIATGQPPVIHGICGNYLYDPDTGEEVMMNDVRFLRAPTIFSRFQQAGATVAIVTAKDKLRALLGAELSPEANGTCCFSAEKSSSTTVAEHGMENAAEWLGMAQPEVYSADLSEFVFAAGVKLLQQRKPDLMYLTTTDYVQHKHAPGDPDANSFYEMFDKYLGQLDAMGAAIVTTADHGMKPKHKADGSP